MYRKSGHDLLYDNLLEIWQCSKKEIIFQKKRKIIVKYLLQKKGGNRYNKRYCMKEHGHY